MTDPSIPPHQTVVVHHSNNDYSNACLRYGGGWDLITKWEILGDLLAHRTGWHFEIVNGGEALWSLGVLGESRLNIYVQEDGQYHCFDYREDTECVVDSTAGIEQWLSNGREEANSRPSDVLIGLASDQSWNVLKTFPFRIEVTFLDGWFIAAVESLPQDAVFEQTVSGAIQSARILITRFFGAPESIATQLTNVSVALDSKATAQLIR